MGESDSGLNLASAETLRWSARGRGNRFPAPGRDSLGATGRLNIRSGSREIPEQVFKTDFTECGSLAGSPSALGAPDMLDALPVLDSLDMLEPLGIHPILEGETYINKQKYLGGVLRELRERRESREPSRRRMCRDASAAGELAIPMSRAAVAGWVRSFFEGQCRDGLTFRASEDIQSEGCAPPSSSTRPDCGCGACAAPFAVLHTARVCCPARRWHSLPTGDNSSTHRPLSPWPATRSAMKAP
jgi:hypothetical protein